MLTEKISITGKVQLILVDEFGHVKSDITVPNMIVTSGLRLITARLGGFTGNVPITHIAIGSNSTAVDPADTSLKTSPEGYRKALSSTPVYNPLTPTSVKYTASFIQGQPGSAYTIKEAGLFTASSGGIMLARTIFSPINKGINDILTINWTITIN